METLFPSDLQTGFLIWQHRFILNPVKAKNRHKGLQVEAGSPHQVPVYEPDILVVNRRVQFFPDIRNIGFFNQGPDLQRVNPSGLSHFHQIIEKLLQLPVLKNADPVVTRRVPESIFIRQVKNGIHFKVSLSGRLYGIR